MCALSETLTVREVCALWQVARGTVVYHCNAGHFRWRDSVTGVWLVDRASVVAYWGPPRVAWEPAIYEQKRDANRVFRQS